MHPDGPMDRPMDGPTDGPTKRGVGSRSTQLKRCLSCKFSKTNFFGSDQPLTIFVLHHVQSFAAFCSQEAVKKKLLNLTIPYLNCSDLNEVPCFLIDSVFETIVSRQYHGNLLLAC